MRDQRRAVAELVRDSTSTPLTVLQSGPRPLPTTNPYNILLAQSVEARDAIDYRYFSWREALLGRHEVFHAHWPEAMLQGRTPLRSVARQALFALLLVKWKARRTAVVRTVHNIGLPQGISRRETLLLHAFEHQTVLGICLNEHTPVPHARARHVIPHGHYRPWYDRYPRSTARTGHFAYFGMIRRYKGVDGLVRAFQETTDPALSLTVAGKPSTPALGADLEQLVSTDPRIRFAPGFLENPDLVTAITEAEMVVLPHPEMHNSGSALAALSLDRPVLIQDNAVNRDLQSEVGAGWVHLYAGNLTGTDLIDALEALRANPPTGRPRLETREWDLSAALHEDAYRHAASIVNGGPRSMRPGLR
ncbi:glycosyltransferase [Allobranchiibius sp. GilTou38]|uniref:glycosyltransferase n=1 Tax=Allobranchiibius sp. GilTou38 TaxID=2815210 RepID=UPI001AA1ACF6|nr:glycosyltransferase [Allobranchiibius sp. GilTou38]MBO1767455.1 glycosyltransferase [Allobranchiibius sp. GilTou38]